MNKHVKTSTAIALIALSAIAMGACFPSAPLDGGGPGALTDQSIEGTWSGVVTGTYLCEGSQFSVELTFTEDTVAVTGGTITEWAVTSGASGTYEATEAGHFVVKIDDGGELGGILMVDVTAEHAVIVLDANVPSDSSQEGYIGVLQMTSLETMSATSSDLVGNWQGNGVTVDSSYSVSETVETSFSMTNPDGLLLDGTYGTSALDTSTGNPFLGSAELGFYRTGSNQLTIGTTPYTGAFVLSYDKQWLAAAYLTNGCSQNIFDNLPAQKFALYERQP